MAFKPNTIRNGFCYVNNNGQHRVVLKIDNGKVWYASRGNTPVKETGWNLGHTKSKPPALATFAAAVVKRLVPRPKDATNAAKHWRKLI